jgi:hypothetical protein
MTGDSEGDAGESPDREVETLPEIRYDENIGDLDSEVRYVVEDHRENAVFRVESDPAGIWFSGMNGNLRELVEAVGQELFSQGYRVGPVVDDGVHAVDNGGVLLPVNDGEAFPAVPEGETCGWDLDSGPDSPVRITDETDDTHDHLRRLRDPSNYEFKATPHGEKLHIVGVGLPPSILVRGRQAEGSASAGADIALCGTVSEFEDVPDEEIPADPEDDLSRFCLRCSRQASAKHLLNRGKFEDRPL